MSFIGPVFVVLACLAGAVLSVRSYEPYGGGTALSIAMGAAAIVAMSLAMVLSARPRLIEPFFGGLDRMYVVHRWLGIAALALMVGHNLQEADLEDQVRESRLGELAEQFGEIAFYSFIGLILLSWFKHLPLTRLELPWPLWRQSHRLMGVFFAMAAFHQLLIDKPAGIDGMLAQYLNGFSLAGLAAWGYTQFFASRLRQRHFTLRDLTCHGSTTLLTLAPKSKPMRWRPGQFAFICAPEAGLPEPHPFTIAGAPHSDGSLRLAIKPLGDWTSSLPDRLHAGVTLLVEGPYGRFNFRKGRKSQIWLAGGIGITPFLAWAESLKETDPHEIVVFWSVASHEEAFAIDALQAAAARNPNFRVHLNVTAEKGRLTADKLAALVPFPIREADFFFCGPNSLKNAVLPDLKAKGLSSSRIHFERFELR